VLTKDGATYKVGGEVLNFGPLGDPATDPKAAKLEELLGADVTARVNADGVVDQLNNAGW
jgi:hypothetical protein